MKKTLIRTIALTASLSFFTANPAFPGGSIGHGDFSVYNDAGKLSRTLSGHNPVEDGTLLVCTSKCLLKSQGISLIASNNARVAVASEAEIYKLYVKEGEVKFIINNNSRKLAFYTPQGTYTVAEVIFNASGTSVVRGSIVVDTEGKTEISVTEGRMVFATADGMKTVDAAQKIVLAMMPGSTVDTSSILDSLTGENLAIGGALILAIALVASNNGGGGGTGGDGGTGGGGTGGPPGRPGPPAPPDGDGDNPPVINPPDPPASDPYGGGMNDYAA